MSGVNHSYDPQMAVEFGVCAAVLLKDVFFVVGTMRRGNVFYMQGRYWMPGTVRAIKENYPEFTDNQVRYAIKSLKDAGMLDARKSGHGNEQLFAPTPEAYARAIEEGWTVLDHMDMRVAERIARGAAAREVGTAFGSGFREARERAERCDADEVPVSKRDAEMGNFTSPISKCDAEGGADTAPEQAKEGDPASRSETPTWENSQVTWENSQVTWENSQARNKLVNTQRSSQRDSPSPLPRCKPADAAARDGGRDGGAMDGNPPDEPFERFWRSLLNPNGSRAKVRAAFEAACEDWRPDDIVNAYEAYANWFAESHRPGEERFAMSAANFLTQRRGLKTWGVRTRPAAAVPENMDCPRCGGPMEHVGGAVWRCGACDTCFDTAAAAHTREGPSGPDDDRPEAERERKWAS